MSMMYQTDVCQLQSFQKTLKLSVSYWVLKILLDIAMNCLDSTDQVVLFILSVLLFKL